MPTNRSSRPSTKSMRPAASPSGGTAAARAVAQAGAVAAALLEDLRRVVVARLARRNGPGAESGGLRHRDRVAGGRGHAARQVAGGRDHGERRLHLVLLLELLEELA